MLRFTLRKLVRGILMLAVVSILTFGFLSAAGGDALTALSENPQVSPETIERLRAVHGTGRPLAVRYASWLGRSATGDLGESFIYRTPVGGLILSRLANTAILGLLALMLALLTAIPAAYWVHRSHSPLLDALTDLSISLTASVPRIVSSLVMLLLIVSFTGSSIGGSGTSLFVLLAASTVMAFPLIAIFLAQAKGELARAGELAFVQFARAKGLSDRGVILKHAFREALNPVLTILGLSFGSLVSGSVIVEVILGWPGIGSLMVAAVRGRDVPLVMGIVVVTSIAVWLGNSAAELLQLVNDPRLRSSEGLSER